MVFEKINDFTAAGGLGAYGSDESEDERSLKGSDSSDTDEEELRHRIRQKQDAFRRKEQERQELEEHVVTNPGKHQSHMLHHVTAPNFILLLFSPIPLISGQSVCPFYCQPLH